MITWHENTPAEAMSMVYHYYSNRFMQMRIISSDNRPDWILTVDKVAKTFIGNLEEISSRMKQFGHKKVAEELDLIIESAKKTDFAYSINRDNLEVKILRIYAYYSDSK